jgi:hypothetical protein
VVESPRVNLVAGPEEVEQLELGEEWMETAQRVMPARIDLFRVTDGQVRYIDPTSDPEIDISMSDIEIEVEKGPTLTIYPDIRL